MTPIRFARSAETDLLEAWLSIAEENPLAADRVIDVIFATASALTAQPRMGRERPELASGLRSFPTSTNYILYYTTDDEGVLIVRVLHRARDIGAIGF
ncbi:MAG: type II toxin-antitoxin system RelE/ParE family toxin [Burkholderiales bacterium]